MEYLGFYIGDFFIAYYGLLILLGVLFGFLLSAYQIKKYNLDIYDFITIVGISGVFGILGAKILYLLVSISKLDFSKISDLEYINSFLSGGFVFYGGLIGAVLGLFITRKMFDIDVFYYIRVTIPAFPLAHALGRIGCALVGCCYGMEYSNLGSITYYHSHYAPNNIPLFPSQLIEAVFNVLLAIFLFYYVNRRHGEEGLSVYLITYSIARFILEFFRGDIYERGAIFFFSTSQIISLLILISTIIYIYNKAIFKKRRLHKVQGEG